MLYPIEHATADTCKRGLLCFVPTELIAVSQGLVGGWVG